MKPRSTNRRCSTPLARRGRAMAALTLGVALTAGCSGGGTLMQTHASTTRKADAQKQWDAMRGGVKLQLAESLLRTGQLDEAEKAVAQAIEAAPDGSKTYLLASKVQLEKGELAKAREAIRRSLSLEPRDAGAHYVCGIIAQRYGDWAMAFEHYAMAAQIDPRAAEYMLAEVEALIALDKPVEAKERLNARLEDFDGNAAVHLLAARLNQMFGLRGPAAQDCRDALRLGGVDEETEAELGMILAWAGQNQEAIGVLRPLVERAVAGGNIYPPEENVATPVTPEVLMTLARAYEAESQWRDVQWALKSVISRRAPPPAAWCLYSRASVMLGELDSAWEAAQAARRQGEPAAEASLLAAYIAARRGDHESVIRAAQDVLRTDLQSAAAYCLLGESYEATGRLDDARWAFATAAEFELRPESERRLLDSPSTEDGNDGGSDDCRDEKLLQDAKEPRTSVRAASRTSGSEAISGSSDSRDGGNKDNDSSCNDEPTGGNGYDRIDNGRSDDRCPGPAGDGFSVAGWGDACQTNRPAWLPIADRMPSGTGFGHGEARPDAAGSSRSPDADDFQNGIAHQPATDFESLRFQPRWIVQEGGRRCHPIVFTADCSGTGGADRLQSNAGNNRTELFNSRKHANCPQNEGGLIQNNDDGSRTGDEFCGPPFPFAELPGERAASTAVGLGPVESP